MELINWENLRKPLEKIIEQKDQGEKSNLATLTWTEAGQLSTLMKKKYDTHVIGGKAHHFSFLKINSKDSPTILVKVSRGLTPNIPVILKRIQQYEPSAIHLTNIVMNRGSRPYATASIYLIE